MADSCIHCQHHCPAQELRPTEAGKCYEHCTEHVQNTAATTKGLWDVPEDRNLCSTTGTLFPKGPAKGKVNKFDKIRNWSYILISHFKRSKRSQKCTSMLSLIQLIFVSVYRLLNSLPFPFLQWEHSCLTVLFANQNSVFH